MSGRHKKSDVIRGRCKAEAASYVELCLERLREQGGRISDARLSVIHILSKAEQPLVPKEIVNRAQSASGSSQLDLVSVYRNIEALVNKGLVHQIGHNGGYFPCMHAACGANVHVLTHCNSCHRTHEVHLSDSLNGALRDLIVQGTKTMSKISTFQIDGLCSKCANLA